MDQVNRSSYLLRVLIAIDQLGNAIAGGNPDNTISARTGYFANVEKTKLRAWWLCMETIIDFAFKPIDGPRHSYKSYKADIEEERPLEGSEIAIALLGVLIVIASVPIAVITRIWVLLVPGSAYQE